MSAETFAQLAALFELKRVRRQAGHFADRVFEAEHFQVA